MKKENKEKYIYYYWCYNHPTGTTAYPNIVKLDIVASSEEEALKIAKKMVTDRGIYELLSVRNIAQNKG